MADDQEAYSEKLAFAEILEWSLNKPTWQRDALRRIVLHGSLTTQDIEQLVALSLNEGGVAEPFSAAHIVPHSSHNDPIALLSLSEATGINALVGKQSLTFEPNGLTVIYGDNGSGKSGYVRVLKNACRSRDSRTAILRSVDDTGDGPQSAVIQFSRGGTPDHYAWTPNGAPHQDLPSVSIFDSHSANIHVEKTNAVAYIPQPMQVLETLANACDAIKEKLQERSAALAAQTPASLSTPEFFDGTAANTFVRSLTEMSSPAVLQDLVTISVADTRRLTSLETDLAQDPGRAARRIERLLKRVKSLREKMNGVISQSTEAKFFERDALRQVLEEKQEAARLASESLFKASPLPQIGEAVWRNLWEAARTYSEKTAYPGRSFPTDTIDGDLCVLCQQPLSASAVAKQSKFEAFIKGTTKTDEVAAASAVDKFMASVQSDTKVAEIRQLLDLIQHEIGNEDLAREVRSVTLNAAWRARALRGGKPAPCSVQANVMPEAGLDAVESDLRKRADALSADDTSEERRALIKDYRELKDRTRLILLKSDVLAEINRRKTLSNINKVEKKIGKRAVTSKNKELSDKIVTNLLRGRFQREVGKLKLTSMPVELRKIKDQNAVSYFRVCLVERPNSTVGDIFSEGEHRCVALAAFLAELVTARRYSGIVFDDPMSSLDHIHRQTVAARLVEEALHRQVIIFTHDLTFLYEVRREAEAKDCSISYRTIRSIAEKPGYVTAELPQKAKSAKHLAQSLRSDLKAVKGEFDHWPDARRTLYCKGFTEQLREAWDQGIADFIFPVLGRFDNGIKGGSLYRLAVLTDDDVQTVTEARSRLSEGLHVEAKSINPVQVTHETLRNETLKLEVWLDDISKRQADSKKPTISYS